MATHFQANAKCVSDLFNGIDKPVLIVPPFQRGYSWEKKHVDAFWRDLLDFMEEKKSGNSDRYFFGPIVILEHKGKKECEILDGQQRLATITILFAAIRDAAKKLALTISKDSHMPFIPTS